MTLEVQEDIMLQCTTDNSLTAILTKVLKTEHYFSDSKFGFLDNNMSENLTVKMSIP